MLIEGVPWGTKTPPSYVSTSCSSNAAIFREYRHWPCANPGPVPTTPVTPPMALPGPSCSYSAVRRGDNSMMTPHRHLPRASLPPHTPWQMDITQQRTATTYLSKVSEQRAVKNFISWKWNLVRVQVSATTANIREHSKHRYIQPSCMAAERGLCARLPPSFGHYTALNIVGKDPTDQSTSWMSTTDEPSDHEPMSASPVHVWPLATLILLILSHALPFKPGHYMCCYVAQPVRWTHFTCCDMASPLIKPCPNRLSSGGTLGGQSENIRLVRTAATTLLNSLPPPPFTFPRSTLRRPNWALRHEFSSLLRCLPRRL